MIHTGRFAFRAPIHGPESSFCCWTAGQGLEGKYRFFHTSVWGSVLPHPIFVILADLTLPDSHHMVLCQGVPWYATL